MLKNHKFRFICAFIALIICILQISDTYSKYIDSKDGSADFEIAKWKILVNEQDITQTATLSSIITPIYKENENIKSGVIAPGSEGYFDLIIDASNVDVSFNYIISIGTSENSSVSDLVLTGYSLNDSAIINSNNLNNLTNTVNQTDTNRINNLRIYFKWLEGEGETMDNESDTNASISNVSAKLKVNMTFVQKAE